LERNPKCHSLCCAIYLSHNTTKYPWSTIVFGRDMILNIKHEANWEYIHARKQNIIIKNNKAENAKRIPHTYNIGDKVLFKRGTENKYETPYQGPFTITQVNKNGTVQMMIKIVEDTINIRRLTPYLGTFLMGESAVCRILGSGEQTKIESCIIRIPESMVESHNSSPN
jgi:hypothetical protein